MSDNKMNVNIIGHKYEQEKYYVSLGINGGFLTKHFILDEDKEYSGNYAFFNVLCNYLQGTDSMKKYRYDAGKTCTTFFSSIEKDELYRSLEEMTIVLFSHIFTENGFDAAKEKTIAKFREQYKKAEFRSRLKAYEYADLNKRFTVRELIDDIQSITFSDFISCAENLLTPANMCLYILGNEKDIDLHKVENIFDAFAVKGGKAGLIGYKYNPYLKQDSHVVSDGRDNYVLNVLSYDFLLEGIATKDRYFILDVLASKFDNMNAECFADKFDSGIIVETDTIEDCKNLFINISEREFKRITEQKYVEYVLRLNKSPEYFAKRATEFKLNDIDIFEYINLISKCTYEQYTKALKASDFKISQAQIITRKVM